MMQPIPTPPPLSSGASPWEVVVIREYAGALRALVASRVGRLADADIEVDDAVQRIATEVVLACRQWSRQHGPTKPDERYIWAAIHRARLKLYRAVARSRRGDLRPGDGEPGTVVVPSGAPSAAAVVEQEDRERCFRATIDAVYARLSPADQTLMRLLSEGYDPQTIAASLGKKNKAITQRLYLIRKHAREHLAELGIESLADAETFDGRSPD